MWLWRPQCSLSRSQRGDFPAIRIDSTTVENGKLFQQRLYFWHRVDEHTDAFSSQSTAEASLFGDGPLVFISPPTGFASSPITNAALLPAVRPRLLYIRLPLSASCLRHVASQIPQTPTHILPDNRAG